VAKQKEQKKKKKKRPAHEVLVHEIKIWFREDSLRALTCIGALGTVLNSMIIPNEKISETEKKLTDILVNTPPIKTDGSCVQALQEVIKDFRKEHSK